MFFVGRVVVLLLNVILMFCGFCWENIMLYLWVGLVYFSMFDIRLLRMCWVDFLDIVICVFMRVLLVCICSCSFLVFNWGFYWCWIFFSMNCIVVFWYVVFWFLGVSFIVLIEWVSVVKWLSLFDIREKNLVLGWNMLFLRFLV